MPGPATRLLVGLKQPLKEGEAFPLILRPALPLARPPDWIAHDPV